MKIGELAEMTGLRPGTIRYYEGIGLLPEPDRHGNGYRSYRRQTAERISFIRDAQSSGLSLTEIALILDMKEQGESTCAHVISMLDEHLADVERQMTDLARTRARLQSMVARAREMDPAVCHDSNRCQTIRSDT